MLLINLVENRLVDTVGEDEDAMNRERETDPRCCRAETNTKCKATFHQLKIK